MFRLQKGAPRRDVRRDLGQEHRNNLRYILREALFNLDVDSEGSTANHALAYSAAQVLWRRARKDYGKDADGSSPSGFEMLWQIGTELLRSAAPFRAGLEDDDDAALALRRNRLTESKTDSHEARENASGAGRRLVRFISQMSSMEPHLPPRLVLEMVLYHLKYGMFQEAQDKLEGYIHTYPYNQDAPLVGYAGVLSYILWKREAHRLHNDASQLWGGSHWGSQVSVILTQGDDNGPDEQSGESDGNFSSQHFNKGVQHLATSLQLDGSNDLFLFFYLKLLLASGSYTKARDSARKFVRANPKQPNGYRYLLQIYHRHFKDSPEWVQLAEKLLVIDPVCDEELALRPLVQHYESLSDSVGDNVDTPCALRIMRVLAARIDYDKGGPWIWKQLALCLRSVNANHDGADEDIWKDRRGWWFGWCFLQTNSAKVTLSEGSENVLYKLICAFYIFRESFPFLSLPKMYGITAQSTSTALLDKFGISKHAFLESKARQGNQAFAHTARYVTGTATQPTQEDVEDALSMFWGSLKDEICGEAPGTGIPIEVKPLLDLTGNASDATVTTEAHPGFVEERATLMSEETWSKTNADTTARQPPPSPIPIGQTFSRHIQPPMQQSDERPRKKRRTKGF